MCSSMYLNRFSYKKVFHFLLEEVGNIVFCSEMLFDSKDLKITFMNVENVTLHNQR